MVLPECTTGDFLFHLTNIQLARTPDPLPIMLDPFYNQYFQTIHFVTAYMFITDDFLFHLTGIQHGFLLD